MATTTNRPKLMRISLVMALVLGVFGALAVSVDESAQARPHPNSMPWGQALAKYKNLENRDPLDLRALGIEYLTKSGQAEAISKILRPRYEKPLSADKDAKDYIRWVILYNCFNNLGSDEYYPEWEKWAYDNYEDREHAWLWKRAMQIYADNYDLDWPLQIAKGLDDEGEEMKKLSIFIRGAAFEVLAENGSLDACGVAAKMIEEDRKLLRDDDARAMWLGTFSKLFENTSHFGKEDNWQALGTQLIPLIEEKDVELKTRITMVRAFARAFSTEELFIDAEPWKNRLIQKKLGVENEGNSSGDSDRYAKPKKPPFMGVQGTGTRIAYVIDLSDSMLEPLKRDEIEEIKKPEKKGPVTGGDREKEREDKKKEKEKKENPDDELPWDEIENRWDAAREALILSLKGLEDHMYFTVVLFGSEASYLKCTKGMVQANSSNIKRAIAELKGEKVGSPEPGRGRPYGTLRGNTNLHGGLRLAYKALDGGHVDEYEYVNEDVLPTGADTIFVLSDGEPTYDDFVKQDEYIEGYHVGDPETGQRQNVKPDYLIYHGPYNQDPYIIDDVERMNLFNKCEINCIAIGEARDELLRQMTRIGHGTFRRVGGGR